MSLRAEKEVLESKGIIAIIIMVWSLELISKEHSTSFYHRLSVEEKSLPHCVTASALGS